MVYFDKVDRNLMNERAEDLDELFEQVEKTLPRCPLHPTEIVYRQTGCSSCEFDKRIAKEERKRRRKRRGA